MKGRRVARADMPAVEKTIADIFDRLGDRGLLPKIDAMCKGMHVKIEDVAGKSRRKSIVRARHAVWRWVHDELGLSWPEVAHLFGRTHDTIMQASGKRESRTRKALENCVAEKIAAWLEDDHLADEDPRSFVDPVDRARLGAMIQEGAWRQ